MKRNGTIDFFKFIFAIIVVFHHMDIFKITAKCGFIAVEFYFLVSGYLLMKKADKTRLSNDETIFSNNLQMIKHKYLGLFPFLLLSIIVSIWFWFFNNDVSVRGGVFYLIHCLTDLFPLQFLGFNGVCPIGVGWYLSVLLFVSFVFYPILLKYKDKYVLYFAPIITLLTLGYICYTSGSICVNAEWNGYVFLGMLRGIGVMNLGFICYCLTEKLKKKDFSVLKNSLLTFVECFGYLSAVLYAFFYEIYDSTSFYILALLAVSVIISFSNKSYLQKVFNPKICSFLGGWSFSIYITHFYITRKVDVWFWESSVIQKFVICWIIILIVSLYVHIIGTMISKLISRKQVKKQIKL